MNHDLADELGNAASAIDIPPGDVAEVMTRSRRRSRRHRRVTALGVALAVVATAATVRSLGDDTEATSVATGGTSIHLGDIGIEWSRVDPTTVLSLLSDIGGTGTATASGALYALSTAPAASAVDQALPKVVWRSEDGVDWSPLTPPKDLYLSDLSARDDRLYAVGTGPATARTTAGDAVPALLVSWSDDGAKTWNTAPLPVDLAGIAGPSRRVYTSGSQVAAGPNGVVALVTVYAELDVPAALPAGVSAPNGWALGPDGVDLLGAPAGECPAGTTAPKRATESTVPPSTVPPSTVPPEGASASTTLVVDPASTGGDVPPFKDDNGRVWPTICIDAQGAEREVTPQELQGVVDSYTWAELGVEGDLLQAILGRPFVFRAAPGGEDFSRVDPGLPDRVAGPVVLDVRDGDYLLATTVQSGGVSLLTSSDGTSWTTSKTIGGMAWVTAAGRVGDRLAFIGGDREAQSVLAIGEGGDWQEVSLGDAAGFDSEAYVVSAAFGPNGVVAVLGDYSDGTRPDYRLVASRDGETWSTQSLADLAGESLMTVGGVRVTSGGVVVMAVPEQERTEGEHLRQVALVGTYH